MIVNEMAKLQIDLLLVGGSVCFTAKEKLLKRGIALAVGVKPSVLQRVARCCNTQVLLSPAQVLGTVPGTCGRWRVENVSTIEAWTEPPATKRVTLMYFERCAPELGATIVLRGELVAEVTPAALGCTGPLRHADKALRDMTTDSSLAFGSRVG